MVVKVIDDMYIATDEAKNNAPVGLYRHRPKTGKITFQWVQTQTGCTHVFHSTCFIEQREYQSQPISLYRLNAGFAACMEKTFQTLVRQRLNIDLL